MTENHKSSRILLLVAGALSALLAVRQAALYFYANAHLKELLRNGGGKAFGFLPVDESAARANPNLILIVFAVLLTAACFVGAHVIRKKYEK